MVDDARLVDEMIACARRAAASRLVVASSGNFSVRLSGDRMAISASGARLDSLEADGTVTVPLECARRADGASMETDLHRAVYGSRSRAGAVFHFQSPAATAMACALKPRFDLDFIPEVPAYLGAVTTVDYHHPGTRALAEAVGEAARRDGNVVVLLGHGQIAIGSDPAEALRNAEVFELACDVASRGIPLRRYDGATIETLRDYGRRSGS